jgi:hypothetical protein
VRPQAPATATARFRASRVRLPELIVGVAALALMVDAFAVRWYGSGDAWSTLTVLRYLILLCAVGGLAVLCVQGGCRAPAVPICTTTIELLLSLLTTVTLAYRVLAGPPGLPSSAPARAGVYVGLALCIAIALGAYRSMRLDGIRDADGPGEISRLSVPPLDLTSARGSASRH